jgi:L-glyceraldehyde 3-phosphate reductase
LAQGLLTSKYLQSIPEGSRASKPSGFLKSHDITPEKLEKVRSLNRVAESRGQSMAQLALAWVLRDARITSALIGASRVGQIEECVASLNNLVFDRSELDLIEAILSN